MDVKRIVAVVALATSVESAARAQSASSTSPQSTTPDVGHDKTTSATGGSASLNYGRPGGDAPSFGSKRADEQQTTGSQAALDRIIDRPHTLIEIEGGIIALPNAPISPTQRGGDVAVLGRIGRGDSTINLGIHILYRFHRSWIIGAYGTFAPLPTVDSQYGGLTALPRTHSRSYFALGIETRFIPIHYKTFEAWLVGATGAAIIGDRYITNTGDTVPTILGTKEVTLRTEGFAVGVGLGVTYYLTESFLLGANLRGNEWVLPSTRRCSSIGDCATLSGPVSLFSFGLTLSYRLPL